MTTKDIIQAIVNTNDLREAIKQVKPLKINRQLTVLSGILIDFKDGKATITSNDLETQIQVIIKCNAQTPFTTILPIRELQTFLTGSNGELIIESEHSKWTTLKLSDIGELGIEVDKPEDFPPIQESNELTWHSLDAKYFCRMLSITVTSCALEKSRPVLTGVCLNDGAMAASDGFRLTSIKSDKLVYGLGKREAIIPYETVKTIIKLFGKSDNVDIAFEEKAPSTAPSTSDSYIERVHLKSGNISLISQVIQGTYPNYGQLIPTEYKHNISFSSPLMCQRLKMIDDKAIPTGIVRFVFSNNDDDEQECKMSAKSEEYREYNFTMPVKITTDEGGKIAFNYKYILDAIKPFSLVNLELTSLSSPGKITGDIEGVTIVVMPMFAQW